MARLLGHRQTKGTETDKPDLMLPRHISTLPDTSQMLCVPDYSLNRVILLPCRPIPAIRPFWLKMKA